MRDRRFSQTAILGALILAMAVAEAQVTTPVDHAKRVIDLLAKGQFEGVTQDFNAKMTAALPATQLADVWRTLQQQVGPFKAIIDERSQTAGGGITAVTLGCQFERAALNAIIAFDGESRIAGLRFVPRPAAATPVPAPSGSRFTEEAVTVGTAPWALPGTLSMPSDAVQAGVVLVHGSGP